MRTPWLVALTLLGLLAPPSPATWSIVVVNTRTGEVGVTSATCLANTNLIPDLPVIYPGLGAAAVQSARDPNGERKRAIWMGFENGETPSEIFQQLQTIAGHGSRQYGIVSMIGSPLTWTGSGAGAAKHGVTGVVGDLMYAIQGNVLVGPEPVTAAEAALIATAGDLGQKMMAAMEAARAMGGDGRCSCNATLPNSCTVPPPGTWKSAHTGFILLARVGDPIGSCQNSGCANGNYYLKRNAVGSVTDPDPVLTLQNKYDTWRANRSGRPDHVLSVVSTSVQQLQANGLSTADVHVQLVDIDGVPLTTGGASLTLTNLSGSPDVTTPANVVDVGDGTYTFQLVAGTAVGADDWELKFDDGTVTARLYPRLAMPVLPASQLHSGYHTVSAASGAYVPLSIDAGGAVPGPGAYLVLGSASGTTPGTAFGSILDLRPGRAVVPLNTGPFLSWSLASVNTPPFQNTRGFLDANGRAEAAFVPAPGDLTPWIGNRIEWSALLPGLNGYTATAPAGFDVVP